MARLTGLFAAAAIVGLTVVPVSAQSRISGSPDRISVQGQQARLTLGSIQGVVIDDRGGPLAGAMVSALGAATLMATTDARGRFLIQPLPSGEYQLRVHLPGFVSTRRDGVRVNAAPPPTSARSRCGAPTARRSPRDRSSTAGLSLPSGENPSADDDNHSETAWRLRHIKRSVLKQDGGVVSIADAAAQTASSTDRPGAGSIFGRAFDSAASMAATFFTATPFSGEVNFLTTSAFGPGPMLFSDFVPRGVAYMSIGAPGGVGPLGRARVDEPVGRVGLDRRGIVHLADRDVPRLGVRRVVQHAAVRPAARAPLLPGAATVNDDSRNVGEIYGRDRWTVSPTLALDTARATRATIICGRRSLLSPRLGLHAHAVSQHVHHRQRRAADGRAGRGRVPRAGDRRAVAAARAHVRAARRRGPPRRARALLRRRHRTRVRRRLRPRRPPLPAARRRPARRRCSGCRSTADPKSPGHYFVATRRRASTPTAGACA